MTDIALDYAPEAGTRSAPVFTRRVHALFRLLTIRRRRSDTQKYLHFADDRMLADVGLRRDRHRDDWLNAFLAP